MRAADPVDGTRELLGIFVASRTPFHNRSVGAGPSPSLPEKAGGQHRPPCASPQAAFRPRFLACAAVRFTAQRFLIASARRSRPSGVRRPFRRAAFAGVAAGAASAAFFAAHRFFSAADRRFLPSAVIPPLRVAGALEVWVGASDPSTSRSAESARSIAVFCRSSWSMMPFNRSAIPWFSLNYCGNDIVGNAGRGERAKLHQLSALFSGVFDTRPEFGHMPC